jgi:eukaryotic-like serine/threonine-protein kinase
MPTSREGPPGPGGSGGTDAPTGTDGPADAPPDVRPELAGTRPGYSSSDTDAFARTELIGSKPPELRTPVGTPVEPLADTTVDGKQEVHPGAIDAAAREAERRQRQIEGLKSGTQIGRFTVLDVIGAGGMGVVLVAYDSKLDRKIAIKMLHDDVSEGHGPRLEREAKAMAQLSHPNVVTVHETGTWEGRLYIAMEYVEGETLAEMLRNKAPGQRVVLDLMLQAGRGLAAAHEAGLVHRDFKPDNVLVGKDGRARVSDFGLVSEVGGAGETALDGTTVVIRKKGSTSSLTQAGAVMGTPLYMAPEQHRGQVADDKADQFSFCVTLWQALCGEAPYGADTYEQLVSNVTEGRMRPVPRGIRFPSRLRSIVTRGLGASPSSRYPSMRALLAALERASRPPRWPWVVAGGALAAGGVAAVLAFGGAEDRDLCGGGKARLTGVWDPPRRAAIEQVFTATGSPRAAAMWQRVASRVDRHTAGWVSHHRAVCQATHERGEQSADLLDLRMRCLDRRLADLDAVLDRFQDSPGAEVLLKADDVTASLGSFADCDDTEHLKGRAALPADPAVRSRIQELEAKMAEAKSYEKLGRYAQAREIVTEVALAAADLGYPPLEAESVLARAGLEFFSGDHKAAEKSYRDAAAAAARARDDYRLAKAWIDLIQTLGAQGRHEDALELVPVARTAAERVSDDLQLSARFANNLAGIYQALGKYPEARKEYEKALALQRTIGEDNNPTLPHALNNLGTVLWHTGDLDQAKALFDEARTRLEKTFGPEHPTVAYVHRNLGDLAVLKPDLDAAIAHYRTAQAIWENVHGHDNIDVALALEPLCHVLARKGEAAAAREVGERALALREKKFGPDHILVAQVLLVLIDADLAAGDPEGLDRANQRLARALSIQEKVYGPEHIQLAHTLDRTAELANARGKYAESLAARERGLAIRTKVLGEHNDTGYSTLKRAETLLALERADDAYAGFERAAAIYKKVNNDPAENAEMESRLAEARSHQGRHAEALERFTGAEAAAAAIATAPPELLVVIKFRHAEALLRARKRKEALELARAARASTDNPAFQAPIDAWLKENAR